MTFSAQDCLSCGGKGRQFYLCEWRWIDCPPCNGSGKMERDPDWVELGERLRKMRSERLQMSMGELARKVGVSVVDVSDAERGRSNPEPLFSKIEALALL